MPPLYKRFFIEVDFNVGLSRWRGGGNGVHSTESGRDRLAYRLSPWVAGLKWHFMTSIFCIPLLI